MFDTIRQSTRVEKPDFVQLVSQLRPGTVAGCKWCKKTIFFNGSFWNHIDEDVHPCEWPHVQHDLTVVGSVDVEVGRTFWHRHPVLEKASVRKCAACGGEAADEIVDYGWPYGRVWRHGLETGDCPLKVATPAPRTKTL